MIISHKHKFIFIKTEKTAGTSIEIALSKLCGPEDIITPISMKDEKYRSELGFRGKQNYHIPFNTYNTLDWLKVIKRRKRLDFYNHIPANEIKKRIAPEVWDNYFKFCFERNPFDKVISWYYWIAGNGRFPSIIDFIKAGRAGKIRGFDLYTIDSIPVVDQVYKFENLPDSLLDISKRLKLEEPIILPEKKTKGSVRKDGRHYREILSSEEVEWIAKIFAREIAYFDYKF